MRIFLHVAVNRVHNAPWPDCPNKKCLQRPPELGLWQVGFSQVWRQTVPNSCGRSCKGPVSETAGYSVDSVLVSVVSYGRMFFCGLMFRPFRVTLKQANGLRSAVEALPFLVLLLLLIEKIVYGSMWRWHSCMSQRLPVLCGWCCVVAIVCRTNIWFSMLPLWWINMNILFVLLFVCLWSAILQPFYDRYW